MQEFKRIFKEQKRNFVTFFQIFIVLRFLRKLRRNNYLLRVKVQHHVHNNWPYVHSLRWPFGIEAGRNSRRLDSYALLVPKSTRRWSTCYIPLTLDRRGKGRSVQLEKWRFGLANLKKILRFWKYYFGKKFIIQNCDFFFLWIWVFQRDDFGKRIRFWKYNW